jgi:hypothetical protein
VKPVTVHSIKVTNNFSGLLEVLGCKFETKSEATSNGSSSVTPWETIVSKSSLMTPLDSRGKKNGNLERDLSLKPETLNFLWDKLKFVCQQPFNKELPYGLSAIEIQVREKFRENGTLSAPIMDSPILHIVGPAPILITVLSSKGPENGFFRKKKFYQNMFF